MIISQKTEYALLAIFDLASQPRGLPVRIGDIARRRKIPQKFLELILAGLKQGGFVESRRGAEGGYLLARAPETITVGEVLRHVEGGRARSRAGRRAADAPFTELWQSVEEAVSSVVDKTSFAELARRWAARQRDYVPNWEI